MKVNSPLPLTGTVVVELGARVGASVCGSLLAQLGADVVFVEAPARGGFATGKREWRAVFAAGKRSLVHQPSDDAPEGMLARLLRRADVVLTSSDVDGVRPALGGGEALGNVHCDVTAFGADGPRAGAPCTELEVQALSGIMDATGMPDGPPVPIDLPMVEYMTGAYAAGAVLAALRVRRESGVGQRIDMALYDCAFAAMSTFLPRLLDGSGTPVKRVGNRHSMACPWNVYRADDGWILLCAASDVQWQRVAQVIGRPELGADPRYAVLVDRVARSEEVDAMVQAWVGTHSVAACERILGEASIACGPISVIDGYPREANLDHRAMSLRLADPVTGRDCLIAGSPFRMSLTPGRAPASIPAPDDGRSWLDAWLAQGTGVASAAVASSPAAGEPRAPLSGVRVLEIGHYTTVPLSARHLANLGAEVIKIEPPGGEAVRVWPPSKHGKGLFFTFTNADKKSLVLDLHKDEDAAVLRRLIGTADVLIENLKPGALAKRGFGPEDIAALNPAIVYCAVSGFGGDSLYDERPAFDTVIQAMSGVMDVIRAGDVPLKAGPSAADILGAEFAVVAVLAALEHRRTTGLGQYIDLSMQDIAAWMTETVWNARDRTSGASRVLECSDGTVLVGADLGNHPTLATVAWDRDTRESAIRRLAQAGVPSTPILTAGEMLASPQTAARALWFVRKDAAGESWPLLASPLRLLRTKPVVDRPMADLGTDGPALFAELEAKGHP